MAKRSYLTPKKIGFVIKHNHPEAAAMAVELAKFVIEKSCQVVIADESAAIAKSLKGVRGVSTIAKAKMVDKTDLIVVLGGDGTFLSIARLMRNRSVPVLGVNMGQLGFLTEIKRTEAFDAVGQILDGKKPLINERALL